MGRREEGGLVLRFRFMGTSENQWEPVRTPKHIEPIRVDCEPMMSTTIDHQAACRVT